MRRVLPLLFLLSITFNLVAQDLPKGFTEEEKKIYNTYIFPNVTEGSTVPPSFNPRTMAEWEELQGLQITWTQHTTILRQIVDYAQEECVVYIVCSDSNSVKNTLTNYNIPLYNIEYIEASFNSIWCRDYGAWSIYDENGDNLSFVDWTYNRPRPSDDLVPEVLGSHMGVDVYSTTVSPYKLINTGGNFMTDGLGMGFASELVEEENPSLTTAQIDNILNQYMGITNYVKMETLPYDNIHHIDMHMKLLDEETLLVGQYPPGIADGPQIEANIQYVLNNFQTSYGREFKVVRIPMPPDGSSYPNNGGDYRTYTNSIIVNKTVIVPTYELQYDTTALRIYREAMPGYNVVGIDCNAIIPQLGAIHCITKEIGASEPITIHHAKIREAVYPGNYPVDVSLISPVALQKVSVMWSVDPDQDWNEVVLTHNGNNNYSGEIPQQERGKTVHYYIHAANTDGKTMNKPMTAPLGHYKFKVPEQTYMVQFPVNNGWNLLSIPVKANDMSTDAMFGGALVYGFNGAYYLADEYENGYGFWAKVDNGGTYAINGTKVMDNIEVNQGWNIVAPHMEKIGVDAVATTPANIVASPFYYFDNGYHIADTLRPGLGYWVRTSDAGELSYYEDAVKKTNTPGTVAKIQFTDAAGRYSELFVIEDHMEESYFNCPPCGPSNPFYVSFTDNTLAINSGVKTAELFFADYPVSITSDTDVKLNGKMLKAGESVNVDRSSLNIELAEIPTEFALEQNYPNPFNPSTTITFAIPVESQVKVNIYDMLGRKVKTLLNEKLDAGSHKLDVNAADLASGVYLYSLETESTRLTRKMMLLK